MKRPSARFLSFITVSLFALLLVSGCERTTKVSLVKVIDGFASPESVIIDPSSGNVFVSNVGKKVEPMKKDKDGFISKLSADGAIVKKRYLPKKGVLHAPKGMAIINKTLYVTDIDRVVGFDLADGKKTFAIGFSKEKTKFLNDLAVLDDKTLFVSATDKGKIYKISLGKKPRYTPVINVPGANGLYYDNKNKRLFVVSFGGEAKAELGVITFEGNKAKYEKLTEPIGQLDGIAMMGETKVIFSDWVAFDKPGALRAYGIKGKKVSDIALPEEVHGPADFFLDEKNSQLWLPRMQEGKVMIMKME